MYRARVPQSGALTLGVSGRYCLVAGGSGGQFGGGSAEVYRSGQACRVSNVWSPILLVPPVPYEASLEVVATPGCNTTVQSDRTWAKPLATPLGPAFQQVRVAFDANTGTARTAQVRVGEMNFPFTQDAAFDPACTYTLTTNAVIVPESGGSGIDRWTASGYCKFAIFENADWLSLSGELFGFGSNGGPFQWTVQPNIGSSPRTTSVVVANQQLHVAQLGNPASEGERFIQLLYWSFFGRWPAPEEVQFHLRTGLPRTFIAAHFFRSQEFAEASLYAAGLYMAILNREPEHGGWLWQRATLTQRLLTKRQLVANFLNSEEYRLSFGSPDAPTFVRQMYRQALDREPSAPEVDYQVQALNAGISRADLAANFLESVEFRIKTLPKLHAAMLYFLFLGRDGSSAERMAFSQALAGGKTLESAILDFVNSPELALRLR